MTVPVAMDWAKPADELIEDRLYRLGGVVPLDGRISWVPSHVRGYDPASCYLLREGDVGLLVDTGLRRNLEEVAAQLDAVASDLRRLDVFLTRFEPDCLVNLDLVHRRYPIAAIYGGGVHNPFDIFENLAPERVVESDFGVELVRVAPGERIHLTDERYVDLLTTPVRVLPTHMLHDPATGALMTSDNFSELHLRTIDEPRVAPAAEALGSEAALRDHVLTKFDWVASANGVALAERLDQQLEGREIAILAPTHGRVATDRVPERIEQFKNVLVEIGAE